MIATTGVRFQQEPSLRDFSHQQFIPRLQSVQQGSESSLRHKLKEELNLLLRRGRDDRIGALDPLAIFLNSQSGVLSGCKLEIATRINPHHPQVRAEFFPLDKTCAKKSVFRTRHIQFPQKCLESKTPSSPTKNRTLKASITEKKWPNHTPHPIHSKSGSNRTVVRVMRRGTSEPAEEGKSWILRDGARFACAARRHTYSASWKVPARPLMSQHPKLCRSAAYQSCPGGWFLGYWIFP